MSKPASCENCFSDDITTILQVRSYMTDDGPDGEAVEIEASFDGYICRDCETETR